MDHSTSSAAPAALLEAFLAFPQPLALTDPEGRPQLVNTRFRERFGTAAVEMADAAADQPQTRAATVRLRGGLSDGLEVDVTPVRTRHGSMLIFSDLAPREEALSRLAGLQQRVDTLERLAATDHLTSAWNRAHLDRIIPVEIARSQATRQPLSLILLDIDHFKKVNDTHGHAAGDSVLQELSDRIRSRLRASDVFFRWGGEEFLVLVASAGYRNAEVVANGLREIVAARPFAHAGALTISLGVAEHCPDEAADAWFARLDAALYAAKSGGRNRVVTDRRGSSDTWAAQAGAAALHLTWQEGYASGNPTIDEEHRELFRLANLLIDAAVRSASEPAAFHAALDTLLSHVTQHFADEESILERHHYDQLEQHRRAHAGLLRRAGVLKERISRGEAGLGAIVEYLVQDVVARHMLAVDRAFFPLFAGAA